MRQAAQRKPGRGSNALSVRLELQADCFAGVWAHTPRARQLLEAGDVEEGLGAAAGDRRRPPAAQAQRPRRPETFTHGTSAQRARWFKRGFDSGDPQDCDTFAAGDL